MVGEWEGLHTLRYRPGYVGADLFVANEQLSFSSAEAESKALRVFNLGPLGLAVSEVSSEANALLSATPTALELEPGDWMDIVVDYSGSGPTGNYTLALHSNDPDSYQAPQQVGVNVASTTRLDVGDTIGPEFAFLDPSGMDDMANVQGKVIVLAYFALF